MATKNEPERLHRSSPLSGALASDNGGSFARLDREGRPKRQNGGAAPRARNESEGRSRSTELAAQDAPPKYERARLAGGWEAAHAGPLAEAQQSAQQAAAGSGKPWTLEADKQTRAILEDFPARSVKAETLAKYRADYDRLRARGVSPLEAATTPAHWQRLRTACRFCMAEDVRRWRAASERARKAGDLDAAQRLTAEAHRLAVALDGWFCQPRTRLTWATKAKALAAQGKRPPSKSRRRDTPPAPDLAAAALLFPAAKGGPPVRGQTLAERHTERLALLALTGLRPAEMMAGVRIRATDLDGRPMLHVEIKGAKVDNDRGHHTRTLLVEASGPAATALRATAEARGGAFTLATTKADYRSLNRALARHGLSCYSFRHAFGSDLKAWITDPATVKPKTAAHIAAQAMGHRSTESLAFYGTRASSRKGGRPPIWAVSATEADLIREKSPAYRRSRSLPLVRFPARSSALPPPAPKQQPAPRARAFPTPKPPGA